MKIDKTESFVKRYRRLPRNIQKKVDKQIQFLEKDFYYPSLRSKKIDLGINWWEFRVDYHYRMVGKKTGDSVILHSVGPHDEGLGKK